MGMKRDTLKTIAGLVIIGLIVVVTFLYGNAQRQSQQRHDQAAKTQQAAKPKVATKSTPASQAAKPQAQPKTATAAPAAAKPVTTPAPVAAVADTGGTNQNMPETGATEDALIPVTLLGLGLYLLRRSRRALAVAVRSR